MAAEENVEGEWYRVCLNTIVRKGQKLDSERLRILPMGSKVLVVQTVDRRVRIHKPLLGWCSLKSSNGDTILTKMASDESSTAETPSGHNLHERADRQRENYTQIQTAMATKVEKSNLNASDKHEIQELIVEGDIEKLKHKITAVESQLSEKKVTQRSMIEELQNQIGAAEEADKACEELERLAENKVRELKDIQAKMQIAMTNQIKGIKEDGARPLEPGCVVQFGAGHQMVLGIVRYIGPVEGQSGNWIGLEVEANGDTNGTYMGKTYFAVKNEDKGLFLPTHELSKRLYADALLVKLGECIQMLARENASQE